jgi:hypothetical protein
MALGTKGSGLTLGQSGPPVTMPAASATTPGFQFRLVDYNGIDYIDMEVATDYTILTTGNALDIDIYNKPSEERYLQVGQVLHNRQIFKHLSDRRLFGSVGRKDVRDDFTRDYTSYPRSVLRGTGITYGFDVDPSVIGTSSLTVEGGQSLTNGFLYGVSKKSFSVPADSVASTYNLFIDTDGVLRFWKDNQSSDTFISAPSAAEIISSADKTMLWQITVDAADQITAIEDFRRYVGNIDNKIELIVEENDITHGSFASLKAAVNYMNACGDPSPRVIKIRGTVNYDLSGGELTLPAGTKIIGDGNGTTDTGVGSIILLQNTSTGRFLNAFAGGCSLENLTIKCDTGASVYYIIGGYSTVIAPVANLTIKNCLFEDIDAQAIIRGFVGTAVNNCKISDCTINFVSGAGDQTIIGASGDARDITIENCNINFGSTADNCLIDVPTYISLGGTLNNAVIRNCIVNYPASSTNVYGVKSANQMDQLQMNDCIFNLGLPSNSGTCVSTGAINESIISNCYFKYTSALSTNNGFDFVTAASCSISGCIFEYMETAISASSSSSYMRIFDCMFTNISNSAIYFDTTSYRCIISNNIIGGIETNGIYIDATAVTIISENIFFNSSSSVSASAKMIELNDPTYTIVSSNILFDYETSATQSGRFMIYVNPDSRALEILDNIIYNLSITQGFGSAIALDTTSGSHAGASINGNYIIGFGTDGILAKGLTNSIVNGNTVTECTSCLEALHPSFTRITNNYFEGTVDNNVVKIDRDSSVESKNIFSNNHVVMDASGTPSNDVMTVIASSGTITNTVITNNIIMSKSTYTNGSLLSIDGYHHLISSNQFIGSIFSLDPPLRLAGWDTSATNNMFDIESAIADNMVSITHPRWNTDSFNKGQTYNVPLPMTFGAINSTSRWSRDVGYQNGIWWNGVAVGQTTDREDQLIIEFTSSVIPVGSALTQVQLHIVDVVDDHIEASLYRLTWDTAADGVLLADYASPAGGIISLAPSDPERVLDTYTYLISIRASDNLNQQKLVNGARITYVL